MKKKHPLILKFFTLLTVGSYVIYGSKPFEVSVMTFNVHHYYHPDGICNVISNYSPDFFGVQEAVYANLNAIMLQLPEYKVIGIGRNGGQDGEYSAIFYKKARFNVDPTENGTFWLSNTPDKPSTSWGNTYLRICTWSRFIEKSSGKSFYMYNTHLDHKVEFAREKSVKLIISNIYTRTYQEPFILTGDCNEGENGPAIKYLKGTEKINGEYTPIPLVDTFRVLYPNKQNVGTFSNYQNITNGPKIDFVFSEPTTHVLIASIIRKYDGPLNFPSDHYAVAAKVRFESKPDPISH